MEDWMKFVGQNVKRKTKFKDWMKFACQNVENNTK